MSLRDRLPAAADTWACPATVAMADSSIVAVPGATDSRSWLTLVDVVSPAPKSKRPGPPAPRLAAWVTVMSVPTPYRDCSTWLWAALTPAEAALTVMTRPIPTARPSATSRAWRRGSRAHV